LLLNCIAWPIFGGEPAVKPVNLEKLNTANDEDDPFVSADHLTLYYAANVDGKWDVFSARRSTIAKPFAAGKPVDLLDKEGEKRSPFVWQNRVFFATNFVPDKKLEKLRNFDLWERRGQTAATPLLGDIDSPLDEMHPWVTTAGREFYFSRHTKEGWTLFVANGPTPGPIGKAREAGFPAGFHHATLNSTGLIMYLQGPLENDRWGLFRAKRGRVGGEWSKPEPLTMLNHRDGPRGDMSPCLTADGMRLYFVSDRPGGKGGLDIWYVPTAQLKAKDAK
jgi:hypothetical protein